MLLHGGTVVPASKHRYYPHNTRILGSRGARTNTYTLRHYFETNASALTKYGHTSSDKHLTGCARWPPRVSLRVLRRKWSLPPFDSCQRGTTARRKHVPTDMRRKRRSRSLARPRGRVFINKRSFAPPDGPTVTAAATWDIYLREEVEGDRRQT